MAPEAQRLVGFETVSLGAGESTEVTFPLHTDQLSYVDEDLATRVDLGAPFRIHFGRGLSEETPSLEITMRASAEAASAPPSLVYEPEALPTYFNGAGAMESSSWLPVLIMSTSILTLCCFVVGVVTALAVLRRTSSAPKPNYLPMHEMADMRPVRQGTATETDVLTGSSRRVSDSGTVPVVRVETTPSA